jgi:alkylated DNA repair protein alkB family protein 1
LIINSLLHRDLSNPLHKTNIHHDYHIPYPPPTSTSTSSTQSESFFTYPPHSKAQSFIPLNPHSNHKPLNTTQFLSKRLRWLTLGSQYDWTTRSYSGTGEAGTKFPKDIGALVKGLFKSAFEPESGVVLVYGTKDYMPVHRDVSEECERGLASFTFGCDGLFILAREIEGKVVDENDIDREMKCEVVRVRSGDCVWMEPPTRWCWHAMPKVMGGTCPVELGEWPVGSLGKGANEREFEKWRGWMRGKRVNISCRQVWD